jgi:hypothetical protein
VLRVGLLRLRYAPPQLGAADLALRLASRCSRLEAEREFGEAKFRLRVWGVSYDETPSRFGTPIRPPVAQYFPISSGSAQAAQPQLRPLAAHLAHPLLTRRSDVPRDLTVHWALTLGHLIGDGVTPQPRTLSAWLERTDARVGLVRSEDRTTRLRSKQHGIWA